MSVEPCSSRRPSQGGQPSDAEEACELPLVATVRKNGVRRTPMPVVDRPFSPAVED
jgi:hypothetical protein